MILIIEKGLINSCKYQAGAGIMSLFIIVENKIGSSVYFLVSLTIFFFLYYSALLFILPFSYFYFYFFIFFFTAAFYLHKKQ